MIGRPCTGADAVVAGTHEAEPLDEGALYVTTIGAEQALRLGHLIVLRPAPAGAGYTCYFYNRREPAGVRLIAYQYAVEASVVDEVPELERFLTDFAAAP